ncbi:DUF4176 domain-containing protein [Enterococcus hirae]|uniref:DUF4176 domain-containing protein n=1 Tax=Enterococcus TaxID=1350 RepID=UPI0015F25D3A|nr:DUF4176 domain-containing protein [Enterococcus hirae]EMF0157357.1 DUF4176 domain-containing protein [Enterococcus hirae]MBA5258177.1 DUF4176 domain-containing protein [Enterococcus hirae]MBA5278159.1 DUF4176 domain-containing protein [Enterococcus hirae]MBO1117308.1 DUF4176 domain-containing protein [Enterococcus hirae]MCO5490460.1 DUF4176 domain-containing protein [Enterococcus hirae]
MSIELTTPFLPLGSVLKLKETENDSLYYFIVARAISKNDKGEIFSRYKVAPHPFGDVPSQEVFSIGPEQIVEVLFEGFSNETDKEFLENLLSQINSRSTVPLKNPESEVEENTETEDTGIIKNEDPFYYFRKRGEG